MSLLYFILVSYGFTQIVIYAKIFEKIRPENYFFHCSMCVGFWVGVFLFGINKYTELFNFNYSIGNCFCLGCLSSGTSYVLCSLFGDGGLKIERR